MHGTSRVDSQENERFTTRIPSVSQEWNMAKKQSQERAQEGIPEASPTSQ
jgi:hypothetical protein